MPDATAPSHAAAPNRKDESASLHCDFCGQPSHRVRRVALDAGYDRLQTPHRVRYACSSCSEDKERQRQGLSRG